MVEDVFFLSHRRGHNTPQAFARRLPLRLKVMTSSPGRKAARRWALALAILTCVALSPEITSGAEKEGSVQMKDWQVSTAWRKYKEAYSRASKSNSVRELEKLQRGLDATGAALAQALGKRGSVAADLEAILSTLIEDRSRAINPPRGKRTDQRLDDLARATDLIVRQSNAIRGLRELGATDRWIEQELEPSLESLCDAVARLGDSLEQEKLDDPSTAPLVAKARDAIAKARGHH
jgi:hypothetical protein